MRRFAPFIIVLLASSIATAIALVDRWIVQSRSGPLHVYKLDHPPEFLIDELALAKARETMEEEGFSGALWQPNEDDRTASPDGTTDKYLVRNAYDPNKGFIHFLNERERRERIVHIEFDNGRVTCQLWTPK